jgi:hypothetical protein
MPFLIITSTCPASLLHVRGGPASSSKCGTSTTVNFTTTLQNETTQTGGAICVAHLCHVDLVRLNWGERLRQI